MSIDFNFELTDNSDLVKSAVQEQILQALEAVGIQAESDIKLAMTETWPETGTDIVDTGRLRNSIAHQVVEDEKAVYVGTNSEYGAYVHEGTGKYAAGGGGTPKERWVYRDPLTGETRIGVPQKPRRFIKDTVEKYLAGYLRLHKVMIQNMLYMKLFPSTTV